MQPLYNSPKYLILIFFLFICVFTKAQFISNTKQTFNSANSFINNIGQYGATYKGQETMDSILFGYEGNNMPVLFTKKGAIFLHRKISGLSHDEKEKLEQKGVTEEEIEHNTKAIDKVITMEWLGANTDVAIIQEEKTYEYHTYGLLPNKAYGYKQITYKNLYDGIDLILSINDNKKIGFEYSLKVAAGADISQIKMKYGGDIKNLKITKQGTLIINSDIEGIEQTAPLSFYDNTSTDEQKSQSQSINQSTNQPTTSYNITKNLVSFIFPNGYDSTKSLTIDPFVSSTSNLPGTNAGKAKDIDFDFAGNVYVTGGGNDLTGGHLAKYNSNGILLWTFSGLPTPPVVSWYFGRNYGGMVVDKSNGKIYLGQGFIAPGFKVIRLDGNGLYDNFITTANPSFVENWKLFWNCNNGTSQILAGGGGTSSNLNFGIITAPNPLVTASNITATPSYLAQDVADLLLDPLTKKMYSIYATTDEGSGIGNRIFCHTAPYSSGSISWAESSGFNDVLSEPFNRPYLSLGNDNSANILAINPTYLFYFDGRNLKSFNKSTGATVGTALQLDGVFSEKYTGGVYADDCNNVYVGAANGIIKVFNFNGSNFSDSPADISITGYSTKTIYDLAYNEESNLLYASGDGFVGSFEISSYCDGSGGGFSLSVLSSCSTATATLVPMPPIGSVITYNLFAGGTLIASNSAGIFTGLTSLTNYTIKATISQSCGSIRLSKNFLGTTVSPTPLVTTPILYCKRAVSTALTASGTNLKWYTTATGGTGSTTAPTPSTLTGGTTTFYVTQNPSGGCGESLRAAIVVTVNVVPPPTVVSPLYLCRFSGATPLTAIGSNLKWYQNPVGGTSSLVAQANTNFVGIVNYYVSQSDTAGGSFCESDRSVISVETIDRLQPPITNSSVDYCQGAIATPLTAIGTNLLWYTGTSGVGSSIAPTPNTSVVGITNYGVAQAVNGAIRCESQRAGISVSVQAFPIAPTVTSPVYYCQFQTATPLIAAGSFLRWYSLPVGGSPSSGAPTPNTSIIGNIIYYVSQSTSGGCEGPRAAITVQVSSVLPAPTVISPINYCVGASATALTAVGTNLKWYTSATGGTGSGTAPVPNTSVVGSTNYFVSQSATNGTCESPRALLTVQVSSSLPAPTVSTSLNYCVGSTATALTAIGTNLKWYTSATGGTGSGTAPVPNNSVVGSTSYFVSQSATNGTCESLRATITVQVSSDLPAPTVTSPINYCVGSTATALTAIGTNLKWYTSATGGTGGGTAPVPNTSVAGSTSYFVSQSATNGTCESLRATITVQVSSNLPAPTVTSPINYCVGSSAPALTAIGINLKWYTSATGGTGSGTAPIPNTSVVGSTNYFVSQSASIVSSCESPRAVITVNVIAAPSAPVITNISYCVGAVSTALTATGTNLLWYTSATGGTGSAIAPIPNTSIIGSTIYYVSQSTTGNNCGESPRSALTVQVTTALAAPTVSNIITYCQGATASTLTATGTNLLWYSSSTGGTGSNNAPLPNTTVVGTIIYYVSQSSNSTGGCESSRAAITVMVNAATVAPNVTNLVNYCQGSTSIALTAIGTNLRWYTVATGGIGNIIAPIPSTAVVGSTTYYVSQTVGNCESPRSGIIVNVSAGPSITTQPQDITACTTSATFLVTATGPNLTYQWFLSINGGTSYNVIAGATGTTYTINGLTPAQINNRYRVIVSSSACNSIISNSVTVKVGISPIVLLTATPTVNFNPYTNGGLNVSVTPSSNYTYQWKRNNIVLSNTGTTITKTNGLLFDFGNYNVTATDNVTGCVGTSNTVTVADIEGTRGELFVYPNPSNGIFNISFYNATTAAKNYSLNVYDAKGARVITKGITLTGIYGFANINMSTFANGFYVIALIDATGNKLATKKILKL